MRILLLFLFLWLEILTVIAGRTVPRSPKLQFGANGTFKIVLFADLHYGENAWELWGPQQDRNSDRVMSDVLDVEKPDLVVFLGDLMTANNLPTQNATSYLEQVTRPTAERNIPWAAVFGNHDDMAFEWPLEWFGGSGIPADPSGSYVYFQGTTRKQLMEKEEQSSLSVSASGSPSLWPSVSNFALEVESHSKPGSAGAILYFLDSGGGSYPEVISAGQARWFKNVSAELNVESKVQEFVFWHIPSKAYGSVAPKGSVASPCVGSLYDEQVASQEAEWGMMDILANRPSAKAVVVGHNHGLDWCCPYGPHSLWLCFARHSGYGGYHRNWLRGARVIELSESSSAKSWIRVEDGSILSTFEMDSRGYGEKLFFQTIKV